MSPHQAAGDTQFCTYAVAAWQRGSLHQDTYGCPTTPQIDRSQHSRKNGNKLFRSHFSAQNLSKKEMRCLTATKKSTVPLSLSCRPVTSGRDRVRRHIRSGGGTATALTLTLTLTLALALFTRQWAPAIVVASYVEAATRNEVHKQILHSMQTVDLLMARGAPAGTRERERTTGRRR